MYEVNFSFGELSDFVFIATSLDDEQRVYRDSGKLYVDSGDVRFNIYSVNCAEYQVGTIQVKLPKFNTFSLEEECSYSAKDLEICDEWYQGNLDYFSFRDMVDDYYQTMEEERENGVLDFVFTYYVYFILGGIIFLGIVIFLIIRRIQENKLD